MIQNSKSTKGIDKGNQYYRFLVFASRVILRESYCIYILPTLVFTNSSTFCTLSLSLHHIFLTL